MPPTLGIAIGCNLNGSVANVGEKVSVSPARLFYRMANKLIDDPLIYCGGWRKRRGKWTTG